MGDWDLQWSMSNPDVFVAFSADKQEINMHRLREAGEGVGWQQKEATKSELFLRSRADLQSVKCVAVCPNPNTENILALGLSTGRVVLTAFNLDPSLDKSELVGREIVPKHTKQCTGLAWNPTEHKLLAVSYERHRPDQCLVVYDVYNPVSDRLGKGQMSERSRPQAEFGTQADVVNSVTWLPQTASCLIAGFAGKTLKMFDMRDPLSPKKQLNTKGVHGLVPDPRFEHHLASFFEDQIYVWDLRNFDKHVLSVKEVRPVSKLAWNPHRRGVLMSLPRESSVIKSYKLEHVLNEVEYTERLIQPRTDHNVSNFALHPSRENNMVVHSSTAGLINFTVQDTISVSLSPHSACSMASSRNLLYCPSLEASTPELEGDISLIMRQRAIGGYGLQNPLSANIALLREEDVMLRKMWEWMSHMRTLTTQEKIPAGKRGYEFYGIRAIIKGEIPIPNDEMQNHVKTMLWEGAEEIESRVYKSKERSLALKICSWPVDGQGDTGTELTRSDQFSSCERSACIAVFRLQIRQAIDILKQGAKFMPEQSAHLNAVAMALAGLNKSRTSFWCEMVSDLSRQLNNPYLRAMFSFLTNNEAVNNNYDGILKESELLIEDRLGFACMYLNDQQLNEYLDQLSANIVKKGKLDGVLVTGLNKGPGLDLLQCYVDHTCDVQSASCVMLQTSFLFKEPKAERWIEAYRKLLDTWRLWHQRAKFDMLLHAIDARKKVPAQTFVNCHFCLNPISPDVLMSRNKPLRIAGIGNSALRPKGCYVCKKPLPRCSLCQMNMGTSSTGTSKVTQHQRRNKEQQSNTGGGDNNAKKTDIDVWFTWCQSCRHGGHGQHLIEWFQSHTECPVTGCVCNCTQLDKVGAVPAMDSIDT